MFLTKTENFVFQLLCLYSSKLRLLFQNSNSSPYFSASITASDFLFGLFVGFVHGLRIRHPCTLCRLNRPSASETSSQLIVPSNYLYSVSSIVSVSPYTLLLVVTSQQPPTVRNPEPFVPPPRP